MTTAEMAAQLRGIPARVEAEVADLADVNLRARPGEGEWSAIEVVGHLVDKLEHWRRRVERTASEDLPTLDPYDQDECVRAANYQAAELAFLLDRIAQASERFAQTVESLTEGALDRRARHAEYGKLTLRDCVVLPLESIEDHLAQARTAAGID